MFRGFRVSKRFITLPARPRRKGFAIYRATALVLGTWGASYWLATHQIQLDSDSPKASSSSEKHETRMTELLDGRAKSSLVQQKTLSSLYPYVSPDIDARLNEHATSVQPQSGSGISRYDVVQVASNNPTEDDHAEAILPVPSGFWSLFGVYDGHCGWETSAWLRENLLQALAGALGDMYAKVAPDPSCPPTLSPENVEKTFKDTFKRLDDDIVNVALEEAFKSPSRHKSLITLAAADAGSCALVSFYDSHSRLLHVAITGDSRAILGRKTMDDDGKSTYEVRLLSAEQDGKSPAEEARLNALHPGEQVVKDGRVMGWGMARAFGDARMKWDKEMQKKLWHLYLGTYPGANLKTPPYLTAEPEVTTTSIQPGDFLIMASDGLWECLSNEEAVGLVGWWRDQKPSEAESEETIRLPKELPVMGQLDEDGTVRYRQWGKWKKFVKKDRNAAVHLIRNALGGTDTDLTAALLSLRPQRARNIMDDITVTVIFFDE